MSKRQALAVIRGNELDSRRQVDGPNYNELQRAEELAATLAWHVNVAKRQRAGRINLNIELAEELLQMMSDSIKTAKQIINNTE